MLGMYGAVFAAALIAPLGLLGVTLSAYVGILLTGPVIFVLGAIIHRLVLSRSTGLRAAGSESRGHYTQMILTLGISLIFQNVALAWFGAVPRQNQTPISDQAWMLHPKGGRQGVHQQGAGDVMPGRGRPGRRDLPGLFADVGW
jgi:branched-subunit amino acid ABC-type transport system permease component